MEKLMYPVSVDQAISRGRKVILIPQLLIFIGLPVITYLLSRNTYLILLSPAVLLFAALLAGFYRAYALPAWMIWAFSNVRNVHELKRRAGYAYLVPGEINKNLRKLEIWSDAQRLQWAQLDERFNQPDLFVNDPALPPETRIYYSVILKILSILMNLVVFGFGALLVIFFKGEFWSLSSLWSMFMGIVFMAIGVYLLRSTVRQLFDRKPQITLSDKGIQVSGHSFQPWSAVSGASVIARGNGRYRSFYLQYWAYGGETLFALDGLTVGRKKLDQLLRLYRGRFKGNSSLPYQ
ncbi:hypothetical protein [Pedobacter duraquae]|nr:hypothetical protein [Pedobacter duraquae]